MKKLIMLGVVLVPALVLGAEEAKTAEGLAQAFSVSYFTWSVIVAGFGLALAASVGGLAQAKAIRQALEGMARQPEATGNIQTAMILGLAFIESLVIYVLLVSLILLFVNPFAKHFVG